MSMDAVKVEAGARRKVAEAAQDADYLLDMAVPDAISWLRDLDAAQHQLHEVLGLPAPDDGRSVRDMIEAAQVAGT